MTHHLQPIGDRVLVRRTQSDEKSAGGLFIPDAAKEQPCEGLVVAVGPGRTQEDGTIMPLNIKAGHKVLFSKYAGTEVQAGGETLLLLQENDIHCIVLE